MAKRKEQRYNNDLLNIKHITKDWATRISLRNEDELRAPYGIAVPAPVMPLSCYC